jgi:predicted phosphodiesterase
MLAILYDIHGNLPALEAVLADARRAGAERYLLGGDYALFGAWPQETLELLDELDAVWLRGNGERWTANPGHAPPREPLSSALSFCRSLLDADRIAQLAALPDELACGATLCCHASPGSDVIGFEPEPRADEAQRLAGIDARRVIAGHTHIQFRRRAAVDGVELINPGSVGLPLDGDRRAAYALALESGGSPDGLAAVEKSGEIGRVGEIGEIQLRRVPYDVEAAIAAVSGLGPWAQTVARRLERAELVLADSA